MASSQPRRGRTNHARGAGQKNMSGEYIDLVSDKNFLLEEAKRLSPSPWAQKTRRHGP